MWVFVQITIFLVLVALSLVVPKNVYKRITEIAIIFTFFAIFMPWLLIIQLLTIGAAGVVGEKIIETRNQYMEKLFDTIMRLDIYRENLYIREKSKLIWIVLLCIVVVIILSGLMIQINWRDVYCETYGITDWFDRSYFLGCIKLVELIGDILFVCYLLTYKENIVEYFVVPIGIKSVCTGIYAIYMAYTRGALYMDYIYNDYRAFGYFILLVIFGYFVSCRLKSKLIAIILALIPVIGMILLELHTKAQYMDILYSNRHTLTEQISFVVYGMAYVILMFSMEKEK